MIMKNVTNNSMRYIVGTTAEDGQRLHRVPSERLSGIDYVFIDGDVEWGYFGRRWILRLRLNRRLKAEVMIKI